MIYEEDLERLKSLRNRKRFLEDKVQEVDNRIVEIEETISGRYEHMESEGDTE